MAEATGPPLVGRVVGAERSGAVIGGARAHMGCERCRGSSHSSTQKVGPMSQQSSDVTVRSRHAAVTTGADASAVIETDRILFDGRLGTQRVRVWLEPHLGGVRMLSHDIGSGLERAFGKDEIETFLEVEAVHMQNLVAALRAEWADDDAPMDAIPLPSTPATPRRRAASAPG